MKEGGNFHISRLLLSQRDFKDKHLAGPLRDKAVWISEGFRCFFFRVFFFQLMRPCCEMLRVIVFCSRYLVYSRLKITQPRSSAGE